MVCLYLFDHDYSFCVHYDRICHARSLFSSLRKFLPCFSVLSLFVFLPFLTKLQYFNILCFSLFLPSYKSTPYDRYFRKYKAVHRGRTLPITQWSKMTNIRICVSFCFSFFFKKNPYVSIHLFWLHDLLTVDSDS